MDSDYMGVYLLEMGLEQAGPARRVLAGALRVHPVLSPAAGTALDPNLTC